MAQAVGYSGSEDRMLDSEQEAEIDGVDPWKAAMQVLYSQLYMTRSYYHPVISIFVDSYDSPAVLSCTKTSHCLLLVIED